ncbi:MAG TPA: tRNA 2-thiouridine(34) synthase MnmA [Magnetospirillaceae bacterium]|nr:tRNA 2-thiouridine(34) synthase MnmA [Magnetospirillaceae bacterium]
MTKVYVGMSGGVDSSVAAALLQQQGYDVTGVYMKNWTQDLPGMICPWADDLADAKRVAVQLGIPFKVFDFQKEYKQKVVNYMIAEYQAGRTPNPDIMCNQEVKFKVFLDAALEDGAEMIATGHYARINDVQLHTAIDTAKDQTYFLYRITQAALQKTLFPLGGLTKPQVRAKAEELGLATASKKDSQGICFVGKVGIKDFLQQYVTAEPGDIIDKATGKIIGQHDGAIFYTFGQRHGLGVGGGLPYYVVGKDMFKNVVYVTTDLNDDSMWRDELHITQLHWINDAPKNGATFSVRTRYRAPLVTGKVTKVAGDAFTITLQDPERAITPGQSAVLYDGERVVGGGIVAELA